MGKVVTTQSVIRRIFIAVLAGALILATAVPAMASAEESEFIALINQSRTAQGLGPLSEFWDLTDEIPKQIHVAVPRGAHRPSIDQPPTKVHVFNAGTFEVDRQQARTDADEPFWVYSPERTVVDAIRMGRWIGHDIALHALRRYMAQQGASAARLAELARELGGSARLRPALEALLS